MISKDWNGLNSGVFFLRVNSWSIGFLISVLAFRYYNPDTSLLFSEQSAMEIVLQDAQYRHNVEFVPQRWFNPYAQTTPEDFESREDITELEDWAVRRGDFLIHFAGVANKEQRMAPWLDTVKRLGTPLDSRKVQRDVTSDVLAYWTSVANRRSV